MKSLGKTDSYSQEVLKYRQAVNGVTSKGSPHSAISTIKLSLAEIRTDINKTSLKEIANLKKRVQASETKRVQNEGIQSEIDYMKSKNKSTYEEKIKAMENDVKLRSKINSTLNQVSGLEYSGESKSKHLLHVLVEEIGLEKIRSLVKNPLDVNVAGYYGPNMQKEGACSEDNVFSPTYLEQLISALGGKAD